MYCLRLRRLVLIFVNPLYIWESDYIRKSKPPSYLKTAASA
ncbi:hypothetical protein NMA510612_2142 [Neisseria meningitidis]|uniref:PilS cassette n=2 Tax=Neisseria meningitidis TaxID=487 RepID=A0A0H5QEJ4_NEIMI|nr:hypothetical protein NMA510612_2142 [Neisseria meningitidis]MCI3199666.1 zinc chelation protein SecC [Neisseria meningitidis]CRY99660.1 hypothetical protein [Neisseria meningitidis serogroup B]